MTLPDFFLIAGGVSAFAVAFGMGANNVSNAIGTSVGSGAMSIRVGLILAGIFEFLGTTLMGGMVTATLKSYIISPIHFQDQEELFVLGMFSTMVVALIWILIATHYGLPISATQTIIGGIVGFALVERKFDYLNHRTLATIVISWFLSPVLGAIFSYLLYYSIYRLILEKGECSRFIVPAYYGATFTILIGFTLQSNLVTLGLSYNLLYVCLSVIFLVVSLGTLWLRPTAVLQTPLGIGTYKDDLDDVENSGRDFETRKEVTLNGSAKMYVRQVANPNGPPSPKKVWKEKSIDPQKEANEAPFKFLMMISAAFVAFAHGSNDVSNAAGPYAAIVEYYQNGKISTDGSIPISVIVGCGIGIVLGLFILGYKTLETVGEKITKLTFTKGFAAQLSGATTILFASAMSLPISTTAILIGGIVGVGVVGDDSGTSGVDKQVLLKIVSGWVLTVVVGLLGTPLVYVVIQFLLT